MKDLLLGVLFHGLDRSVEAVGFPEVAVEKERSTDRGDGIDLVECPACDCRRLRNVRGRGHGAHNCSSST